ncbi:MAG: hypothetical protein JWO62_2362 [Acidimicrobiaceae bacterium]|nr:hypothetical protein [Acidimicrobiaceae bacterium]
MLSVPILSGVLAGIAIELIVRQLPVMLGNAAVPVPRPAGFARLFRPYARKMVMRSSEEDPSLTPGNAQARYRRLWNGDPTTTTAAAGL